jgi:hypothetical protein
VAKAKQPTLEKVAKETVLKRFKTDPAFTGNRKMFPPLIPVQVPDLDISETTVTALAKRLGGDRDLAAKIVSLQQKFPKGTVPELVVYEWLRRYGYSFDFQVELYGGRRFEGGLVPDFVLYRDRTNADAWQVQGEYWHSLSRKGFHDERSNIRMVGQIVEGATIRRVLNLWEDDIYTKRPEIFYLALAGVNLRG